MTQQADEYTEPPEDVRRDAQRSITLTVASARAIVDTLGQLDEFLRCYAGPAVQAELRAFCATRGWSPACGTDTFIDNIGFTALALRHAIDTDTATDHADDNVSAEHDQETA